MITVTKIKTGKRTTTTPIAQDMDPTVGTAMFWVGESVRVTLHADCHAEGEQLKIELGNETVLDILRGLSTFPDARDIIRRVMAEVAGDHDG